MSVSFELQLNKDELECLRKPISNAARSLYVLGIRTSVDLQTGNSRPLNYKQLLALINTDGNELSLGREINALLLELKNAGLIDCEMDLESSSANGTILQLPKVARHSVSYEALHRDFTSMHFNWTPDEQLFSQLAALVGLADTVYTEQDVGEFVAYWLSRPESQFSLFQWTQKFVLHLKKTRITNKSNKQVGQQIVQTTAGIALDDNSRKLVEKYSEKLK